VLGVLIARAEGRPLGDVVHDRVLDPLGMGDTGFSVPATDHHRLVPGYMTDPATGALEEFDAPDGSWSVPPRSLGRRRHRLHGR
jgi:CubicO group peptidase (beta-lactamase class C family)